jgi:hypothetical protein
MQPHDPSTAPPPDASAVPPPGSTPIPPEAGGAVAPDPVLAGAGLDAMTRDIAEVPAVEVITATAIHLMSAAAVKLGLAEEGTAEDGTEHFDLDEARKLITALAGLVTAGAPEIGSHHAAPLRDGLKSLQLAFREASPYPDAAGEGPGEKLTGPVYPPA